MNKTEYIIGRKGDIRLQDDSVSRHHAKLLIQDGGYYLIDLNSANGTFRLHSGKRERFIEGYVRLEDQVCFGVSVHKIRELLDRVGFGGSVSLNPGQLGVSHSESNDHVSQGERRRCLGCGQIMLVTMNNCPYCGKANDS